MSVGSLEALFGSYSSQGCVKMGAEIAEQLQLVKPGDEMSYVMLSNMYSASGQWRRAETLRKAMADRGIKKMPAAAGRSEESGCGIHCWEQLLLVQGRCAYDAICSWI